MQNAVRELKKIKTEKISRLEYKILDKKIIINM